jgi:diguanylate cyclase
VALVKNRYGDGDHFDWMTTFLAEHGFAGPTRAVMIVATTSSALVPISGLARDPASAASRFVGMTGAVLAVAMMTLWVTRWPTRHESLYSVLFGTVCASAWSLTQPSAAMAALDCMALAITGGYVAILHGALAVLLNSVMAMGTATVVTVRLARDMGVGTALAAFWLVLLLTIGLPLGIRGATQALRQFATRADYDPLTGLLNRRGFAVALDRQVIRHVSRHPDTHLMVMMIDVDDFKRINDTQGHAAGDRMLRRIAEFLRGYAPTHAAVCRCGGEEFLVAFAASVVDASTVTTGLCESIHRHCGGITASVGVAAASHHVVRSTTTEQLVDHLVNAADTAMYQAKALGGNRFHVTTIRPVDD